MCSYASILLLILNDYYMKFFLGVLSPTGVLIIAIVYLLLLFYALYIILKKEKGWKVFIWMAFVLFFPFIGALIYLTKNFINN